MARRELYKVKEVPSRKLTRIVTRAFLADFKRYGETTIERVRQDNPAEYLRIVTKLLPAQLDVGIQHSFSDVLIAAAEQAREARTIESEAVPLLADDRGSDQLTGRLTLSDEADHAQIESGGGTGPGVGAAAVPPVRE